MAPCSTRVLGIIPARGGSKGIPRKNLAPVAGRPLLYYSIRAAQESKRLTRSIVSTDDAEIRDVALSLGAEVPFLRPADLATDSAPSLAVVRHALDFMETAEGRIYDFACLLQPTCPLRTAADIDHAIDRLEQSDADALVSLTLVEEPHPHKMMLVNQDVITPLFPDHWRESLRRQELPPVYYLNGAIYCARRYVVSEENSLWGKKTLAYVMPAERSVNIDSALDIRLAESIIRA
jgi:CMP-N-acetylneuraminic acid synthetase